VGGSCYRDQSKERGREEMKKKEFISVKRVRGYLDTIIEETKYLSEYDSKQWGRREIRG
jgi:hypothetical protein